MNSPSLTQVEQQPPRTAWAEVAAAEQPWSFPPLAEKFVKASVEFH
jgi:hypothetical protein